MNTRLKDAKELVRSKVYILITEKEGRLVGSLEGMSGMMKLNSLKQLQSNVEDLIKQVTQEVKPKKKSKTTTKAKKSK